MDIELIRRLPKTDLHVHLDGSLRIDTLIELAGERSVSLPAETAEGLRELVFRDRYQHLGEYLEGFRYTVAVLADAEALERVAYELCEDCFEEGVRYVEVRFAPQLHVRPGFEIPDAVRAVDRGVRRATDALNRHPAIVSGEEPRFVAAIILIALRFFTSAFSDGYRRYFEVLPDAPVDSLKLLFDPAVVAKFADCGVVMLDAPDEVIAAALLYAGENPDSKDPKVLAKAEVVLKKIRPFVRKFHSSQYINDLANGDACLAFGWSGDVLQAATRVEEAKKGVVIDYHVPKEGAAQWFDMLAIPADAPNKDNAHVFINYLMRPEVIAKASNFIQYPNGNRSSFKLIKKDVLENESVFPPAEMVRRLYTLTPFDQKTQRVVTGIWTRVKASR